MMTSFAYTQGSAVHMGVQRVEEAMQAVKHLRLGGEGLRGASSLVLAAVAAALMVVAAQMIEAWADGHLLAAWMVLWLVAFASLALLAAPARRVVGLLRQGARGWAEARRRAQEDERTWNAALHDARLMADLSRAMNGIAVDDMRRYRF